MSCREDDCKPLHHTVHHTVQQQQQRFSRQKLFGVRGTTHIMSHAYRGFTLGTLFLSEADRSRRWPLSETTLISSAKYVGVWPDRKLARSRVSSAADLIPQTEHSAHLCRTCAHCAATVPYNNIAARHLGRHVRYMTTDANQLGLRRSINLSLEYSPSIWTSTTSLDCNRKFIIR